LVSNEVSGCCRVGDNVWVATKKGITVFNRSQIKLDDVPPPVYITGFKLWEKDVALQDQYMLDYNMNNIKIDFVGISYKSDGNILYKYKLDDVDSSWNYTTSWL